MRIGIDPSINCTGVCVWDDKNGNHAYYMIPSKCTKKMKEFEHGLVHILPYEKQDAKGLEYSDKETVKFNNIYSIVNKIALIIDLFNPHEVIMEGVSYGSLGSAALVDLCFLNSAIRMILRQRGKKFTVIAPTELKKFACSNGGADKSVIIDAWKRLEPGVSDIRDIKVDDLADSYFLAHYERHL